MRVLHTTLRYGGGLAAAIMQYAEALPEVRHTLAASSVGWGPTRECDQFAERIDLDGNLLHVWLKLRSLIDSGRFDLVHAHSSHAGALLRVMPSRIPVVYTPHALATLAPKWSREWAVGQTERLLGRRRIVVAPVSADEADRIRRLSPASTVVRISNRPTVEHGSHGRFCPELRVVASGRLTRQKDPHFFASVARICRDRGLPFTFTWVGGGHASYEAALSDAGVRVTGWLDADDVNVALATQTVYLHSALYEGAAISVLNAAAHGLPTIARPVPGITELPWVRHAESAEDVVVALRGLCAHEQWARASQRALRGVQDFDRARQRAALEQAYSAALQRGGDQRPSVQQAGADERLLVGRGAR